ncbi:MAG: sugar ABC transporter substrate-binding protein [Oscillospiraceae bacterium]
MKTKKLCSLLLASALVLGTLAGCGGAPATSTAEKPAEESAAAPAGTTDQKKSDAKLNIWVYGWEKASADKITEDTKKYKEATGVEVTVTPIASDSYSTKIQATIAGGNNPDLAFVDAGVQSTQLAAKGKLLGLNQFGAEEHKSKFYESVWDTMTYKDDVYGLRITSNNLALFYNKDMFKEAGLAEPTATWTWDDLRSAAKTLTNPEKNVFGLDLPIYDKKGGYAWTWLPFLWQSGGELLSEDRTQAVFNSEEGVKSLKFWKDMAQIDKSVPLQAGPAGVNRFTSGITAMTVDGPWNLNPFLADPNFKDKFGVVPLPKGEKQATVVGGEGVVAFSNTKYPQEAYDYMVHLTCSDFTEVFWQNWITIPPQPAYKDFYAKDELYGKYLQVFSDQMSVSRTRPFTPSWPQLEDTLGIDLQGYMFNKTDDAKASLDKAAEDVNKILAEEKK